MSAFINRKPWATALLALLFGPFMIMMYLGRGWAAAGYFLLNILLHLSLVISLHNGIIDLDTETGGYFIDGFQRVIAILHGVVLARRMAGSKPSAWFSRWYAVIGVGGLAPLLFLLVVRVFLWEPFTIPSGSNKPSLRVGDLVFVSKHAYGYSTHALPFSLDVFSGRIFFTAPEYGDIAVFKDPRGTGTDYLKRIVGLPGDSIQVIGGILHINGEAVVRTSLELTPGESGSLTPDPDLKRYRERLPNGVEHDIYEVGDSLRFDNTRLFEVPGGHYFAIGDNRDNSLDSRAIGPIPAENLIGRLALILWNDQEQRIRIWD